MKKIILVILTLQYFCFIQLFGQETKTIEGTIIDEIGKPVIGANISVSETSIGTISDLKGEFSLEIPTNTKTVKISFIGYTNLEVAPQNEMFITLQPDIEQLNDIIVKAQRQTVQVTAEKTIVYTALSPTTSSGNAYSVLKNLPGVIINGDGSLFLNGKSGVKVLIDGKNTYLSGTNLVNYLMSLPASSLNKIELINHPSVKYDASGNGGIIDICTQKVNVSGYNVNANTNCEQGKYGRSNNNISLGYRKNELNINGMYGYYYQHNYIDLKIARDFPETDNAPELLFGQNSYRIRKNKSHYYNFNLDFYATPQTKLGIGFRGNKYDRKENGALNSTFSTLTTQNDSTIQSLTKTDENQNNFISNIYIQHKIDSIGKEISVSADGLCFSINENHWHNDVLSKPSGTSSKSYYRGEKEGTIKIYSGSVDMAYPINDKLRFDAGIKSNFVNIENTSNYENKEEKQWKYDETLSSIFCYKENINALYVSTKIQKKLFVAEMGLRVENTNIKGYTINQSYTDLFPNIVLSWHLPNSNSLNFTYNKRIDRPNYQDLNPFIYIFDNYTYALGNTKLKPQFTNHFNLSYIIRKTCKFSLFYTKIRQSIIKSYLIYPNSKRVYVMPTNMSSHKSYGIQGDITQIKLATWFQTSIHTELVQNKYKWIENGSSIKNINLSFQAGLQNRINLPWGCTGEISGFYNSRMAYGQVDIMSVWQISGGIQKNFFEGKASLNIFSNDWFHANYPRIKGMFNKSHVEANEFNDHTILGISFTYRFKKGEVVKKSSKSKKFKSNRVNL